MSSPNPFIIDPEAIEAKREEKRRELVRIAKEKEDAYKAYRLQTYNDLLKKCQNAVIDNIIAGKSIDIEYPKYLHPIICGVKLSIGIDDEMGTEIHDKIVKDLKDAGYKEQLGHQLSYFVK